MSGMGRTHSDLKSTRRNALLKELDLPWRDLCHIVCSLEKSMQILIWFLGIFILAMWSATVWLGHAAASLMLTLPWDQALSALKQIEMPALLRPFLEPFLGGAWQAWVEALAPLLQWTGALVQGSSDWLTSALPVMAWVIWALGSLTLLAVMLATSVAVWFVRRKQPAGAADAGSGSVSEWLYKLRQLKRSMVG